MKIKEIRLDRKTGRRTCRSMAEADRFEKYLSSLPNIVLINKKIFSEKCILFRWRLEL